MGPDLEMLLVTFVILIYLYHLHEKLVQAFSFNHIIQMKVPCWEGTHGSIRKGPLLSSSPPNDLYKVPKLLPTGDFPDPPSSTRAEEHLPTKKPPCDSCQQLHFTLPAQGLVL